MTKNIFFFHILLLFILCVISFISFFVYNTDLKFYSIKYYDHQQQFLLLTTVDTINQPTVNTWIAVDQRHLVLKSAYVLNSETFSPRVHILAHKHYNETRQVKCRFSSNFFKNYSIEQGSYELIHKPTRDEYYYEAYYIFCPLPAVPGKLALFRPMEVTIFAPETENQLLTLPKLAITYISKSPQQFAICVSPLFNWTDEYRLILFLEYYIYQGADYFLIYNRSTSATVDLILGGYQKLGLLEIIRWDEMPETMNNSVYYGGQILAINDCISRSRSKFKYVGILDLDEFLVPGEKSDKTILEIIQAVDDPVIGEFMFLNSFTYVNWPPEKLTWDLKKIKKTFDFSNLVTIRETDVWPPMLRSKIIVKPIAVHALAIHAIWKRHGLFQTYLFIFSEIGLYHLRPLNSTPPAGNRGKRKDKALQHVLQNVFSFNNLTLL